MASSEAMTSSTHSFAYSYGLVKNCFLKICETSKFHNFLIFQPIFIRFSLFCSENFTLSSKIKLDQLRTSPLSIQWGINGFKSFLRLRLFSQESKVHNLNYHLNCAFWITQCTHERVIGIFELRSVHTRDRIWDLAFQSGRRMAGYPANQTCMELTFPVLLYICSARYIGGSG